MAYTYGPVVEVTTAKTTQVTGGKIINLLMDTSLMGLNAVTRGFTVKGTPGSRFIIMVIQDGVSKYYNFETDLFELGHTSKNNLKVLISNSSVYRRNISFPNGGGNYVVKLIPEPGTVVKKNKKVLSINIEKQSNERTITFKPATVNTNNYSTFPTIASTGSADSGASLTSTFTINNASTDVGGFGLKFNTSRFATHRETLGDGFQGSISRGVFSDYWYVQATKAIVLNLSGDGLDGNEVTAANADGLSVGMTLFYHKGTTKPVNAAGGAVADPHIVAITQGLSGVVIGFNRDVAFENGETMTLRAYGTNNISLNSGIAISHNLPYITLSAATLVKGVRADSAGGSSQTVTLNDTHGISGGNQISYAGFGVNNVSANKVSVVTPDCPDLTSSGALDDDGSMTVQLTQSLRRGVLLQFLGTYNRFSMHFSVTIDKHPESNVDILFDLDKIITVGVSGQ